MDAPLEIRLKENRRTLSVAFSSREIYVLPAEYLRVHSPSAEVKGHGKGQEKLVTGKQSVEISSLEPVGNYALKIIFDDGHDTGFFTWQYLKELGAEKEAYWQRYLEKVQISGGDRE